MSKGMKGEIDDLIEIVGKVIGMGIVMTMSIMIADTVVCGMT